MPYTTDELVRSKSKLENELDFDAKFFIKEAQAKIDTKLRRRYKIPFRDPVPSLIESIATNFAAGFVLERDYSNRPDKNEPYLAEVLIRRAEADLADILENALLDNLEGVEYAPVAPVEPAELARPALVSTTPRKSPMERAFESWP